MSRPARPSLLAAATLATAAAPAAASTHWGDPTNFTLAADGRTIDAEVSLDVSAVELTPCDGSEVVTEIVGERFSLSSAGLTLPVGAWCGVALEVAEPVELTAWNRAGRAVSFSLDVPVITLALDGELVVSDEEATETATIELMNPGWYTSWSAREGRRHTASGGATRASSVARSLADGSALVLTAR